MLYSTLKSIRRDQQYRTLLSQFNISEADIQLLDTHSTDSHSFIDLTVPNPLTPTTSTAPSVSVPSADIDTSGIHSTHSIQTQQPVPSTPIKGPQTGINTPLPSSSTTAAAARANSSVISNNSTTNNGNNSNTQRVHTREEPSEMATPVTNHIGIAQRNNRDDPCSTTTTHPTPTTPTAFAHTLNKSHSHTGATLITTPTPLTQKQGPKPEKTVDQKALKSSQSERILSLHTPYNTNSNNSNNNDSNSSGIDSRETTPMINISKQVWVNTPESNSIIGNIISNTTPVTTNNIESKRLFSSTAETLFTVTPETSKSTSAASVHTELDTHAPQSKLSTNSSNMSSNQSINGASSNNRRISSASDITVQQYQHQQQPYLSAVPVTPDIPTRRPETYHALKLSSTTSVDVNSTASTAEVFNKSNHTSSATTAAMSLSTSTRPIDRTSSNTASLPFKTSKTATSTTSTLHTPSSATPTTTNQPSKNTTSFSTSSHLAVESLLFHTSDYHVKPIVDNRLIETIQIPPLKQHNTTTTSTTTNNTTYNNTNNNCSIKLNYPIFSSETLSNMSYDDISTHIMCIYKQLSKYTPTSAAMRTVSSGISGHNSYQTNQLNERCYILTYLLSLSSIKDVANTVVNSHLLGCLLRSIQQTPPTSSLTPTNTSANYSSNHNNTNSNGNSNSTSRIPTAVSSTNQLSTQYTLITECRHLAATILAYVIRFATYIPILHNRDDHIVSSIVPILLLSEGRSVSDVKLRRRLMAALGELSFYISSQDITTTTAAAGATSAGGAAKETTVVTPTTSKLTSSSSQQQPYSDKSDRSDKSTKVSATTSHLSPEGEKEKEKEVVWSIHSSVVEAFEAVLCEEGGGDEVTLHYACKVSLYTTRLLATVYSIH